MDDDQIEQPAEEPRQFTAQPRQPAVQPRQFAYRSIDPEKHPTHPSRRSTDTPRVFRAEDGAMSPRTLLLKMRIYLKVN